MKKLLTLTLLFTGCRTVWEGQPRGAFLVAKGGLPKECREMYEGVRSGIIGNVKAWKLGGQLDLSACGLPSPSLVKELRQQLEAARASASAASASNQTRINELEAALKKAEVGPGQLEVEILKNRIKDLETELESYRKQ